MTLQCNQTVCQLIRKGYFAQAKDRIININVDVDEVDEDGRTVLILCSFIEESMWSTTLARFVLQLGANIRVKDCKNEMNVLHYCCILEREELLDMLLESVDFDINLGDSWGNSPLIYAIIINNSAIIESLIRFYQKYKINVDKANTKGINAFMQASLCRNMELVKTLMDMGASGDVKDVEGKSATQYKEEAISKLDILSQFNDNRRQSRMVRFDDIELIVKLQQETISLRQDAYKMVESIDPNAERVRAIQQKIKKLKRNKVDFLYVSKSLKDAIEYNKKVAMKTDMTMKKIRPKTSIQTSKTLREKNDWYSIVGPLFVSLEQQHAPSFRIPVKPAECPQNTEIVINNHKQRNRRLSIASLNSKILTSNRLWSNEDRVDVASSTNRTKKRTEDNISVKTMARNFSRLGIQSSSSSICNGY